MHLIFFALAPRTRFRELRRGIRRSNEIKSIKYVCWGWGISFQAIYHHFFLPNILFPAGQIPGLAKSTCFLFSSCHWDKANPHFLLSVSRDPVE
jgi:hypothetical protein